MKMCEMCETRGFGFGHENIIFSKKPSQDLIPLTRSSKNTQRVCSHTKMSTSAQFPWHLRAYLVYIYSLYMGTCEHDIKDAYEQLIPKTLKTPLTKQTKKMYYSNNLML